MNSPSALQSRFANVLNIKLLMPVIFLIPALSILAEDYGTWRLVFTFPLIVVSMFGVSIATVKVQGGVLRYRRFFTWTAIHDDEIKDAGTVWPPFIGYLRLNRSVLPWGRIYFALDAKSDANPFHRGDYPLISYIKNKSTRPNNNIESNVFKRRYLRFYVLSFLAGLVPTLMLNYLLPHYLAASRPLPSPPLKMVVDLWRALVTWPWGVLTATLMSFVILRQPFSKLNSFVALIVGVLTAQVILTAIH